MMTTTSKRRRIDISSLRLLTIQSCCQRLMRLSGSTSSERRLGCDVETRLSASDGPDGFQRHADSRTDAGRSEGEKREVARQLCSGREQLRRSELIGIPRDPGAVDEPRCREASQIERQFSQAAADACYWEPH